MMVACRVHTGLGQHSEAAQHTGAGNVLKLSEVLLSFADGDQVPGDQGDGEQEGTKKHRPRVHYDVRTDCEILHRETDQKSHSLICSDLVPGRSPWRRE